MNDQSFVRALASLFVEELARRRALAPELARLAVVFRVRDPGGMFHACTALLEDASRLLDGEVLPPGLPAVTITSDEATLRALFDPPANAKSAPDVSVLASSSRLAIDGPPALVQALAACFPRPADAQSVRYPSQIPRAKSRGPA
jgi:hypothetical protein